MNEVSSEHILKFNIKKRLQISKCGLITTLKHSEYFYAYMGTATCRAFAKILEVLHHVCFTFSDNQPTLHSHNIKWHSISSGFALLFFGNPRNEIKMNALSPKLLKLGTINSSEMFQHRYGLNLVYYIYLHILQN